MFSSEDVVGVREKPADGIPGLSSVQEPCEKNNEIVDGKDPENAAQIEPPEHPQLTTLLLLSHSPCAEKNSRDQEAAEHKKELNAPEPPGDELRHRRKLSEGIKVVEQHREHGESAKCIQLRHIRVCVASCRSCLIRCAVDYHELQDPASGMGRSSQVGISRRLSQADS